MAHISKKKSGWCGLSGNKKSKRQPSRSIGYRSIKLEDELVIVDLDASVFVFCDKEWTSMLMVGIVLQ